MGQLTLVLIDLMESIYFQLQIIFIYKYLLNSHNRQRIVAKRIKPRMKECLWERKKTSRDISKLASSEQEDVRGVIPAWEDNRNYKIREKAELLNYYCMPGKSRTDLTGEKIVRFKRAQSAGHR